MSYSDLRRSARPVVTTLFIVASFPLLPLRAQTGWPLAGMDIQNSRYAAAETTLSISNVNNLAPQWIFQTSNDVSATPSVDPVANAVYFTDWSGNLIKLNASTGAIIWEHNVSYYGMATGVISRNTPTLAGGLVIFGTSGTLGEHIQSPAYLNAVDPNTGELIWQVQVDPALDALLTGSPVVYNNIIYAGISSGEERLNTPTFRGSVIAVSLANGEILWKTYMVPSGYSGGPIWSSTPAVDVKRNQLYVTTGNNYLVPASVQRCEQAARGHVPQLLACQSPANHADSIVALDLTSGVIKWAHAGSGDDNFILSCLTKGASCPDPAGEDYDFGSGANFFTVDIGGIPTDVVGAGQKSGEYRALDPDNGKLIWKTSVGPGGILGGIQWGTAVDGKQVYVAISNSNHAEYTLQPSGMKWYGGSWAALDAATGAFVWQVPDPGLDPVDPIFPADSLAPVTTANGVVYVASMSGALYALNATSGTTLWTYRAAGSVNAAPAVFNGVLYWGSGYHNFPAGKPVGTASNKFYSFALGPGK